MLPAALAAIPGIAKAAAPFASALLPGLLGGGSQLGAPAPAYSPGAPKPLEPVDIGPEQQPQPQAGPSLFDIDIASLIGALDGDKNPIESALGGAGSVLSSGLGGGATDAFKEGSTPQAPLGGLDKLLGGVDGFLGGLDEGLQSPAQLLGLGLLGQLGDRRLPLAGLLAMGLFNQRKP